jgi:hypothetical protein
LPGPPPKPPELRQRANKPVTRPVGALSNAGNPPRMPRGLCKSAQIAWVAYWNDVISGVTRESDTSLVLRWIKDVDRYHRLIAEADHAPMVTGSTGQQVVNPIYTFTLKLRAAIERDEAQLGVGPLNRMRLGAVFTETQKTLADLKREAQDWAEDSTMLTLITGTKGGDTGSS